MRSGDLDTLVALQHRVLGSPDSTGEKAVTYSTYATVWAQKLDIAGKEYFAARQTAQELTTRFRIRYLSGVVPTDRILIGGSTAYDVHSVAELGRKEGLELITSVIR